MENDREQHEIIFDATHESLSYVAENRKELIHPTLQGFFYDAWLEAKQAIKSGKEEIRNRWEDLQKLLESAGLVAKQLRLKFEGVLKTLKEWRNDKGNLGLLKQLLAWLRSFFGSLVLALPVCELIKEFIDTVLNLLEGKGA